MTTSIAILAGGLATRLYPVTKTIPKSMLEVAGKPFIAHQLELLKRKGISKVVLCVGNLGEQIQNFVKDGSQFGLTVDYSFDGDKLLGTGGALLKASPLLEDPFFVMYGDSYLETNYITIQKYFETNQKLGLMTVYKNNNQWDTSNIVYKNGTILKYDKKNRPSEMEYIDYGLSLLNKKAFLGRETGQTFDLADLLIDLIDKKEMLGYEVKERFYEIGSQNGLKETAGFILKKETRKAFLK